MVKTRFLAIIIFLLAFFAAYFDAVPFLPDSFQGFAPQVPFRLGLDLQGGVHLVYRADVESIELDENEIPDAMSGLRDVIERRVNFFGVTEPVVQLQQSSGEHRLIIELPGIQDVREAVAFVGETPFLEFRILNPNVEPTATTTFEEAFLPSTLTGRFLKKAILDFNQTTFEPEISIEFIDEGAKIFEKLTEENVGKPLAIYLDGAPISTPNVREKISGGRAQITGQFTVEEAKTLVRRLNSGALPIPIELISQQAVGASLGEEVLDKSIRAGIFGILAVVVLLLILYRFLGLTAIFALAVYISIVLMFFKLIPVTLTAAGIAGFILSVGVAVDANILIFDRIKEERKSGKDFQTAISEGFTRAWTSIRDSNISTLITATILYWFGTSIVKGFALTLGIGILISLFTSFTVVRTYLTAINFKHDQVS